LFVRRSIIFSIVMPHSEYQFFFHLEIWGRCGHDRIEVGFITIYAVSTYHH